jgi:hypothetical protein
VRLLGEEHRLPGKNVRADHVLDRIQDLRVADQLLRPGVDQMRLVAIGPGQVAAARRLGGFEPAAKARGLRRRQRGDRTQVAVAAIVCDLGLRQELAHERSPSADLPVSQLYS